MADVSMNAHMGPVVAPLTASATPAPPPAAPPPAAPAAEGDRVTLNTGDDGVRAYKHERDGRGVDYQTWQARSGVKYEVASAGGETQFKAELPKGMLPQGIEIEGRWGGQGTQVVAHPAGDTSTIFPTQVAPDGKILVGLAPNGPMAMFDPKSMDFGLSSPTQVQHGPSGQPQMYQALQEEVHPDNSHTIRAHATVTEQAAQTSLFSGVTPAMRESSFIQIEDRNGQVSGKQVTLREPLQPNQQGGFMGQVNSALMGPARNEVDVNVSKQADGSFAVGGGTLMGHFKSSLNNPLSVQSPLLGWLKGRQAPASIIKTFSSDPTLLSTLSAAAGPVAAMAAQTPFPAPNAVPPPPAFPPQ